jgi:hypothetical protein
MISWERIYRVIWGFAVLNYNKAFVTRVNVRGGGWTQCRLPSVWRRPADERGATRMNSDMAACHFRTNGAAVSGRVATLAHSDGASVTCHNTFLVIFAEFCDHFSKGPCTRLRHRCYWELISDLIQLLLGNFLLCQCGLVSGHSLLSVCVCNHTGLRGNCIYSWVTWSDLLRAV